MEKEGVGEEFSICSSFYFGGIRGGHHEYIIWQFGIIHNGILYY